MILFYWFRDAKYHSFGSPSRIKKAERLQFLRVGV